MRRILLLLAVLLVTAALAAPVSASPLEPCIINCYGINATSTSAQ